MIAGGIKGFVASNLQEHLSDLPLLYIYIDLYTILVTIDTINRFISHKKLMTLLLMQVTNG